MASFNDTLKQALCELQDSYKEYIEREFVGGVTFDELIFIPDEVSKTLDGFLG